MFYVCRPPILLSAILLPLLPRAATTTAGTLRGRRDGAHYLAVVIAEADEQLILLSGGGGGRGMLPRGTTTPCLPSVPVLLLGVRGGAGAGADDEVVVVLLEEVAHAGDVLALVDHGADLAEVGRAAAQGELEVVELELLAAGDLGVPARLEAHALEELGHDLVEHAHRLGQRRLDVAVGEEQPAHCARDGTG